MRRRKTLAELDSTPAREYRYAVTVYLPNGTQRCYELLATSPSIARDNVLSKMYDRKVYDWFVTDVSGRNAMYGNPNVIVQKMDGIRKTVHKYKIEVVTHEQYKAYMEACIREDDRMARERYYGG